MWSANRIAGCLLREDLKDKSRLSAVSATDKAKDKAPSAKVKAKEATGRATDDRSPTEKGKAQQVSGDLKQAGEKVKDAFKH